MYWSVRIRWCSNSFISYLTQSDPSITSENQNSKLLNVSKALLQASLLCCDFFHLGLYNPTVARELPWEQSRHSDAVEGLCHCQSPVNSALGDGFSLSAGTRAYRAQWKGTTCQVQTVIGPAEIWPFTLTVPLF